MYIASSRAKQGGHVHLCCVPKGQGSWVALGVVRAAKAGLVEGAEVVRGFHTQTGCQAGVSPYAGKVA